MAGIQLSGLASGFDWKTTVSQLMSIERVPQDNLKKQQAAALKLQSAYNTLKSNLTALKTAASALSTSFTGSPRAATVSSGDGVTSASDATVSTSSGAALGTYTINVKSLPKASTALGAAKLVPSLSKAQSLTLKSYRVTEGTVTVNGKKYTISKSDLDKTISQVFSSSKLMLTPTVEAGQTAVEEDTGVITSFGANNALLLSGPAISMGGPGDTSNFLSALGINRSAESLNLVDPVVSGSNALKVSNAGLTVGQEVSALWLPAATTITAIAANGANSDLTVSSSATMNAAAGSAVTAYRYAQTIPQSVLADITLGDLDGGSFTTGALKINGVSVGDIKASASLGAVVSQINSVSGTGVTATIDPSTGKLRLTANANGDYSISATDDQGGGGVAQILGLNTLATSATRGSGTSFTVAVDGGPASAVYTSPTAEIDLARYGFGSTKVTPATTGVFSVKVTANGADSKTKINSLISAYNALKQMVDESTKVTTGVDGTVTASVFSNRSDINSLLSSIRSRVYTEVEGEGVSSQYNTMGKIGIGFDKNGTLSVVDSAKLDAALTSNPSAVNALLNSGSSGISLNVVSQTSLTSFMVSNSGLKVGQTVSAGWLRTGSKVKGITTKPGGYDVEVSQGDIIGPAGNTATYSPALANQGIATRLVNLMTTLTGTGGLVSAATSSITTQNKRLQNQINAMDRSLAQQQAALEASFIAMERAQSKYNSMSSQISSAFSSSK